MSCTNIFLTSAECEGGFVYVELFHTQANTVLGRLITSTDPTPINSDHKITQLSVTGLWTLIMKNKQYK